MRDRMVNSNLRDPTGWTRENNPHPYYLADELPEDAWQHWFEFDRSGHKPVKCHSCIVRAKIGSGNCRDHGEYFICLPKEVREGKKPMPKRTVQVKLW